MRWGGTDAPVLCVASCTTSCSGATSAEGWWSLLQFNSVLISEDLWGIKGAHGLNPCAQLNKPAWKCRRALRSPKTPKQMLNGASNLGSPCCLSVRSACVGDIRGPDILTPGCFGFLSR